MRERNYPHKYRSTKCEFLTHKQCFVEFWRTQKEPVNFVLLLFIFSDIFTFGSLRRHLDFFFFIKPFTTSVYVNLWTGRKRLFLILHYFGRRKCGSFWICRLFLNVLTTVHNQIFRDCVLPLCSSQTKGM